MRPLLSLLFVALATAAPAHPARPGLSIAVAASAARALEALVRDCPLEPAPRLTVGASGKFYQQIRAGAPFDLLFAADDVYPRKLTAEGLARAPRAYARGRLVLWAGHGGLAVQQGLKGLVSPVVRHVAIANPAVAPYGQAAVAALRRAGLYAAVSPKFVLGESAAQAAQFAASGAAEAGLLPLSLAFTPELRARGSYWLVPASLHPPLNAQAVVLTRTASPQAAEVFLAYVTGPRAAAVWRRYGFEAIAPSPKP